MLKNNKINDGLYFVIGTLFVMMIMYMLAFKSMRNKNEELEKNYNELKFEFYKYKKMGKKIGVAYANEQTKFLGIEELSQWEPKNITKTGTHVFFNIDGKYVSMLSKDYKEIFELIKK